MRQGVKVSDVKTVSIFNYYIQYIFIKFDYDLLSNFIKIINLII